MKYFIDTWGWVELVSQRASRHAEVRDWFGAMDFNAHRLVTTDYILDEAITFIFQKQPSAIAIQFLESLDSLLAEGYLEIERIDEKRFNAARKLRLKYDDKPDISFTDLTSMVVMLELHITHIVTADAHFLKVGEGFQLLP